MIGKTLGHYQIVERIGAGGMGVVFRARDTHLDRFVAIKVLPADEIGDPERRRRFVQEAKAASALKHPNIVTVHDIACVDGIDFIVMECVAGKTLGDLIPRKGMRLSPALRVVGLAVTVGVLLGGVLAVPQDRPDVATFASKVDLVTVDAVVVDDKGHPVRGLTALDFDLFEDGKPQKIESFEAFDLGEGPEGRAPAARATPTGATNLRAGSPASRTFVLLVDDLGLAPSRQQVVRNALARFAATGLKDGDEVIFATTSGDAWWSTRLPEGREDVTALAARVRGRNLGDSWPDAMSDWEAYRISHFEHGSNPSAVITARVVQRYLDRQLCDQLAIDACRQMVQQRSQEVDQRRVNHTRDILAIVDRAVFTLTGVRGRKALLLLSEGFLNDTDLPVVREVTGRCREANLVVYSLDVRGLTTGQPTAEESGTPNIAERSLMQMEQTVFAAEGSVALAEDTGGFAVSNTNDLGAGALRVADESRTYYLLGYAPPEGRGPRDWRKVKVEIKRPGLKVRARKGYTLRTAAEIAGTADRPVASHDGRKPKRSKDAPAESMRIRAEVGRALARAQDADGIPLRTMAYTLDDRPAGTVRTLLVVEIDGRTRPRQRANEHARLVLTLSVTAAHRDSGRTQRLDQRLEFQAGVAKDTDGWLAVLREFDLPPGVVQARVVVREETDGQLGALSLRFVVPEASAFRLSTPVLTDRVKTSDAGGPGRPVPTAHRDFKPEGRIYCQFEVFGPAKGAWPAGPIEASYVIRKRDGEVTDQSDPSPIRSSPDGRLMRLLVLSADGMAPGEYELVLRVVDTVNKETRETVEPFRILPAQG